MTRLTDIELRNALDRQDWNALWLAADPWVKFAMAELNCGSDDALQVGRKAAGKAVRTWRPEQYAFSTHIRTYARSALIDWLRASKTGGVGSAWQARQGSPSTVISLNDPVVPAAPGDDSGSGATHLDHLTYGDLGFTDGSEDELLGLDAPERLSRLLDRLHGDDSKFMKELIRAGGVRAFSRLVGVPAMTISRQTHRIVKKLVVHRRKTSVIRDMDGTHLPFFPQFPQTYDNESGRRLFDETHSCPMADWSYKPTAADLAKGAAPRDDGYPWSAGARRVLGLRPVKET
jgi:hypothetical protein